MISGHGHEQKFKYPYPWDSKIIQMPYPRAKATNQIPALCPASPHRLDIDRYISLKKTIHILLGYTSEDELLSGIPLSPELATPEVAGCSSSELSSSSSSLSDRPESSDRPSSLSCFAGYTGILANRFD